MVLAFGVRRQRHNGVNLGTLTPLRQVGSTRLLASDDVTPGRSLQTAATRERVLATAAALAASGGAEAVSIRAVSASTGIQAPTIYRLFGNKQGLLDAVTEHGFAAHVRSHPDLHPHADPVDDLRWGWDAHVAYALSHPHEYQMTFALPHPGSRHPAAVHAEQILAGRIHRVAEAGRLRVTERRALQLVEAGGAGTALTLLATPEESRDPGLSASAREAVIAAITTDQPQEQGDGAVAAALHLSATLHQVTVLTRRERKLLEEWLERLASA